MNWKTFWLAVGIGIPIAIALVVLSPEFSRLGVAFLFEIFALGFLYLIDKILLSEIDFVQEIVGRKNVAVAILISALLAIPFLAS